MEIRARMICKGEAQGEAFVVDGPFSFIGDFDPETGNFSVEESPLFGKSMAQKILVCDTGKGGTIAPFIAYTAKQNQTAPTAIILKKAEPILCESALIISIPVLEVSEESFWKTVTTGDHIVVRDDCIQIEAH